MIQLMGDKQKEEIDLQMWYNVITTTTRPQRRSISVDIITSSAHFRQRVVKKSYKIGVTKAAEKYRVSRNAIYEWRKRYDGTLNSLRDKSHRPHHHPNEHTPEEKEAILRRYPRYKDDKIRL